MHPEDVREYCLSKPGATEELPFGPDTLVFKVMGKIFALMGLDQPDCPQPGHRPFQEEQKAPGDRVGGRKPAV